MRVGRISRWHGQASSALNDNRLPAFGHSSSGLVWEMSWFFEPEQAIVPNCMAMGWLYLTNTLLQDIIQPKSSQKWK